MLRSKANNPGTPHCRLAMNPAPQPPLRRIHLQVETDFRAADKVLTWFEDLNNPPLADQRIWWQCQTVVKEIFDNVVDYAHRELPTETPIVLEAVRFPDRLELRIWDYGPPFNLQGKLDQMLTLEENDQDRGRGLRIIEKIADHISCERTHDNRNCFLFVKYC